MGFWLALALWWRKFSPIVLKHAKKSAEKSSFFFLKKKLSSHFSEKNHPFFWKSGTFLRISKSVEKKCWKTLRRCGIGAKKMQNSVDLCSYWWGVIEYSFLFIKKAFFKVKRLNLCLLGPLPRGSNQQCIDDRRFIILPPLLRVVESKKKGYDLFYISVSKSRTKSGFWCGNVQPYPFFLFSTTGSNGGSMIKRRSSIHCWYFC